jgi:hypothetical protein
VKKTQSFDAREIREREESAKLEQLKRKFNLALLFDPNIPEFQNLIKVNPDAAFLQLECQSLLIGVVNNQSSTIEIAKAKIVSGLAKLTQLSVQPSFKLSKIQIANFYGIGDTVAINVDNWLRLGRVDLLLRLEEYKLVEFISNLIDAISVAMAIASKRLIFVNEEFSITYGVSKLESNKLVRGELFISVVNSIGVWSFDKDDNVRIKVKTLRAAKKAVSSWRGANLTGEITHDEARRIVNFLGLVPVSNGNSKFVMLKNSNPQKGFS